MSRQYDKPIIDIVDYLFNYEIKDESSWRCARMALRDAMGCAIETASKSEECRRMLGPIVPGTVVPGGFRLPGTSYVLDPVKGAFDMGVLIRYLDHNDALGGAEWGHPSGKYSNFSRNNIGAILAVADWLCCSFTSGRLKHMGPPLSIRTLLTAIIKAYEIQGCYQMRNAFNMYGIDHVILVKLASTAVVSWLLGLTKEQTMASISHVWMDGNPSRIYRSGTNTIPRKGWAAADASMRAVHLSLLTKAGQIGALGALSDPKWGFYTRFFGNKQFDLPKKLGEWVIKEVTFKIMPVEGHAISSVEAALIQKERLEAKGLGYGDIQKVDVRTTAAANLITNKQGPLYNAAGRDHCIQYVIALALLKGGPPEAQDYSDDSPWAKSRDLAALRKKIEVRTDDQLTRDYLNPEIKSAGSGITIYFKDSTVLEEVLVEFPAGHVRNNRTASLQQDKFLRNMGLMFSDQEIQDISFGIEDDDMKIMDFVDLFTRPNPASAKL